MFRLIVYNPLLFYFYVLFIYFFIICPLREEVTMKRTDTLID